MNNPKSMVCSPNPKEKKDALVKRITVHTPVSLQVLGWVSLITVAGVSFYFAKQSINERRRQQQDISGERPSARLDCEPCGHSSFIFVQLTAADHHGNCVQGRKGLPETETKCRIHRHRVKLTPLAQTTRTSTMAPGSPAPV